MIEEPTTRNAYVLLQDKRVARRIGESPDDHRWTIYFPRENSNQGVTDWGQVAEWPMFNDRVVAVLWDGKDGRYVHVDEWTEADRLRHKIGRLQTLAEVFHAEAVAGGADSAWARAEQMLREGLADVE